MQRGQRPRRGRWQCWRVAAKRDRPLRTGDAIAAEGRRWRQLLADGTDAEIEHEVVQRLRTCRTALNIVDERLGAIGYPVRPIVADLPLPVDELCANLDAREVTVPPILAALWREVGQVSVLSISSYVHTGFWEQRGVGYVGPGASEFCDGLHIESPTTDDIDGYLEFVAEERFVWIDSGLAAEGRPFEFPIAPDGFHKDNISGGSPYGLVAGERTWDDHLTNFWWPSPPISAGDGAPDLISYLRTAILECGCFPGFLESETFVPDRRYLTKDLPIF